MLVRHATRHMLYQMVDAVAAKMEAAQAEYEQRLADQQEKAEKAAAKTGGPVTLPPGAIDDRWRADKARAAVRNLLKTSLVCGLADELAHAREAAGNALQARLAAKDEEAAAGEAGGSAHMEPLEWQRFELLRAWERLGIPPRPPHVLGEVPPGRDFGGKVPAVRSLSATPV